MKVSIRFVVLLATVGVWSLAYAQFRDRGLEVGVGGGAALALHGPNDPAVSDNITPGGLVRVCLAYPVFDRLQAEIGGGYTQLLAQSINTEMGGFDARLKLSPFHSRSVIPYIFAGVGWEQYNYAERPPMVMSDTVDSDWVMFAPLGLGVHVRLSEQFWLEGTGAFNLTNSQALTPDVVDESTKDHYLTGLIGIRTSAGPRNPDVDGDGLLNKDEKQLGTDPKTPDTDGDGLSDGDEVHTYYTDPLKTDTDADGLTDGLEVTTRHTDPLKADTDGDGLNDGDEVTQYQTDPLKADTDGDGLNDGAEVTQYQTDPLKADTDGDGLNDGAEVTQYKTDPLKADTDGGTVDDGTEVHRGSNPLNPSDDVPKIVMEVNKPIVLPGIEFKTASAEILPASEKILNDAYETLRDNKNVEVEIGGHTDSQGSDAYNQKLSEKRAESVKAWLVTKGVAPERITTKGYGESKPIADNKTEEGRQQNRRIEFTRTK